MRFPVIAAATLLSLAGLSAQSEAAALSARIYENDSLQALGGTSTSGALTLDGSTSNFSRISINAFGTPFTPEPSLIGQTTAISSASGFDGPVILRIELTQTDLSSSTAGGLLAQLATTFTANLLINGNTISNVTLSTFADASNTPYATTSLLATTTYGSGSPAAMPTIVGSAVLGNALFSETLVVTATFNAGGAGFNTSTQVVAQQRVTVSEPASIALFGTALLAIGMVARRRQG